MESEGDRPGSQPTAPLGVAPRVRSSSSKRTTEAMRASPFAPPRQAAGALAHRVDREVVQRRGHGQAAPLQRQGLQPVNELQGLLPAPGVSAAEVGGAGGGGQGGV